MLETKVDSPNDIIGDNQILIVDDQVTILKPLEKFMGIHNIKVQAENDPHKALKQIEQKNNFDLVILDVLMPNMDGYAVCRKIREKYSMYELPVIFITGKNNVEDIVNGFEAGANDYIFKPFNMTELLARSRNLIKLKKLAERNKVLNASIDFKNRFHQMTIHDLKNPLSSIMLLSDIVQQDIQDDKNSEYLDIIHQSTQKMLDLINNFLDLHKLEAGVITLNKQFCFMPQIIDKCIIDNKASLDNKHQTINFEHNFPNDLAVKIDKMRIEQVVDNLISNAIKYSSSDTHIEVRLVHEKNKYNNCFVTLSVADQGQGYTESDFNKIFQRFQQLSAKPTGGETSTGIGLAICKEIINLHNGQIWAKNNGERGSTLSFKIPV
jgi:signal transduction histidine kinase